jgi:transposase
MIFSLCRGLGRQRSYARAISVALRATRDGRLEHFPVGLNRRGIPAHAELILSALAAKSDITLSELQDGLRERGVAVAVGLLWRFFKRRKITRKKRRRTPPSSAAAR